MKDLGVGYGWATAISNNGQVAGNLNVITSNGSYQEAYIDSNGVITPLGTMNYEDSTAQGVNDSGEVVGDFYSTTVDMPASAYVYDNGTMYNLNDLVVGAAGYGITDVYGINDSGQILAEARIPSMYPIEEAVVLTPTSIPLPTAVLEGLSALPLVLVILRKRQAVEGDGAAVAFRALGSVWNG